MPQNDTTAEAETTPPPPEPSPRDASQPVPTRAAEEKERSPLYAALWELVGLGVVILLGFLLLGGLFAAVSAKSVALDAKRKATAGTREEPRIGVAVMPIETTTVVEEIRLPGLVAAWTDVDVATQVGGKAEAILVEDGEPVRKGQPLLRIEKDDYRIAVSRAEAALRQAEEAYKRTRELHRQNVRSAAELDVDRSAYEMAKTALEEARLALRRCDILSPIDGQANEIHPEVGELLSVGDLVATVLDIRKVKVDVAIPEKDINAVRSLDACDIFVDAVGENGTTLRGEKIFLSYKPIPQALVYTLRLAVENEAGLLRPGMFVEADIVKERRRNAIQVPLYAVMPRGEAYVAYVVEGEDPAVARERKVTLGLMEKRFVEIRSGLRPGERLVVLGQRSLADGAAVNVLRSVKDITELAR